MVFTDNDPTLTNASVWTYAVTSQRTVQTPVATGESGPSAPTGAVTIPGLAHQAVLNYVSSDCTTPRGCWIQLRRAACASSTSCPTYTDGSTAFTFLQNVTFPVWNTTDTGTTWQILDADPALADGTTYVYVATLCWSGTCAAYSPASSPWSGTTTGVAKKTGFLRRLFGGKK